MKPSPVEISLRRAAKTWARLRRMELSLACGSLAAALVIILDACGYRWMNPPASQAAHRLFLTLYPLLLFAVALFWLTSWILLRRRIPTALLAKKLETANPPLLDRLHTLAHLETQVSSPVPASYLEQIRSQAGHHLSHGIAKATLQHPTPWVRLALFAVLLPLAIHNPWKPSRSQAREALASQPTPKPTPATEPESVLSEPKDTQESKRKWGEVLITEPARDMQVTKLDVIPLQIEAAASHPLEKVEWLTGINGANEQAHPLPAPSEPRYGIFKPTLFLDEFSLSDWDVLTYYAKAHTQNGDALASQVYFLEVRPFREEFQKLQGAAGEDGQKLLNELTGLIQEQQHVIRETHRHLQSPPQDVRQNAQDRAKLSDAETDLSKATRHLTAKIAEKAGYQGVSPAEAQLAKAQQTLHTAAETLLSADSQTIPPLQRQALEELVAARKAFSKALCEASQTQTPTSPDAAKPLPPKDALPEIAEFRSETQTVQQALTQAIAREQLVARDAERSQKARSQPSSSQPDAETKRAAEQRRLSSLQQAVQKQIEELQHKNPKAFKGLEGMCQSAQAAVQSACIALQQGQFGAAATAASDAAQKLESLRSAQEAKSSGRDLAAAHTLGKLLAAQTHQLADVQQNPSNTSPSEAQRLADRSRDILNQLQQSTSQPGSSGFFGPQLQEALSESQLPKIHQQLDALRGAQTAESRGKAAGQARDALASVQDALEKSLPRALQQAHQDNPLEGTNQNHLQAGISQLNSLLQRLLSGKPTTAPQQQQQAQEALSHFEKALTPVDASSPAARVLLAELRETLTSRETFATEGLERLLSKLQSLPMENATDSQEKSSAKIANVDSQSAPPAFRSRVEKYFQKLSEK